MSRDRTSLLENICSAISVLGLLTVLVAGVNAYKLSNSVEKYLIEGNRIAAQKVYERKKYSDFFMVCGLLATSLGICILLGVDYAEKDRWEENRGEEDNYIV